MGYPYLSNGYNQFSNSPYSGYMPPAQRLQNYEQQMQQIPQSNMQQGSIIWVQGAEGAKSYMIPPNSNVLLMDSEGTRFYIKSTDNSGMPSLRMFEFKEITGAPMTTGSPTSSMNPEDFVPRREFEELKSDVDRYRDLLSALTAPVSTEGGNSDGR